MLAGVVARVVRWGARLNHTCCGCERTDSYCSSRGLGIGLCSGEIFLRASYVEVGIHGVGSYGTSSNAPAPFQANKIGDKRLGFMADYDKNGWDEGNPPYSGDYFVPGTPVEGRKCKTLLQQLWRC